MKKLLIALLLFSGSTSFSETKSYEINGEIPGAKDRMPVYLLNGTVYPPTVIDSTTISNNKFAFKGVEQLKFPTYLTVNINKAGKDADSRNLKSFSLFAENSKMDIYCPFDSLPSYYYDPNNWRKEYNVRVAGSSTQKLYDDFNKSIFELKGENNYLQQEYLKVYHIPAIKGEFNTKQGMAIIRQQNKLQKEIKEKTIKFVQENNKSVVAAYFVTNLLRRASSDYTINEINSLVKGLDKSLHESNYMKDLEKAAENAKATAKGLSFNDIKLKDKEGKRVNLSEFVKPGQVNMLEFWASWCGPCRAEIPHLRQLYEISGKKGFNMISISIDERDPDWKKAMTEEGMVWTQLCDDQGRKGPVAEVYKVNGIPYCILLDKDGKIMVANLRGAALDVFLEDVGLFHYKG